MKFSIIAVSITIVALLSGCSTAGDQQSYASASNNSILVVTANNMNASTNRHDIDKLMDSEVAKFSRHLKQDLAESGRSVTLEALGAGTQQDIARAIANMSVRPGILVQVYWTIKPDNSLYVRANVLRIKYSGTGRSVRFTAGGTKDYISIGRAAKPSDTPAMHAKSFSQYIASGFN